MTRHRLAAALAAALLTSLPVAQALAQSCAMCGNSFGQNDPVQRAFSWSILFLMATPYTIVGSVAAFLFIAYRRAASRRRAAVIDLDRVRRPVPASGPEGELS